MGYLFLKQNDKMFSQLMKSSDKMFNQFIKNSDDKMKSVSESIEKLSGTLKEKDSFCSINTASICKAYTDIDASIKTIKVEIMSHIDTQKGISVEDYAKLNKIMEVKK